MNISSVDAMATKASARLPFDVLTITFSHLEMPDVFRATLVCKEWRQAARSDPVMRSLCWQRARHLRKKALNDLQEAARPAPADPSQQSDGHHHPLSRIRGSCEAGATSWEDLLRRSMIMERIKFPPAPATLSFLEPCPAGVHSVLKGFSNRPKEVDSDIWRARIDPIENVMITTGSDGGLTVVDLDDGKILWRDDAVKWFANLEYSEGWVVHDRPGQGGNQDEAPNLQIRKFERLSSDIKHPRRGHLVTTGTIRCKFHPEALRLVWPHLVVGGCGRVAVYDVRDNRLVEHFRLSYDRTEHPIRDVDMDDDYIFVLYGWRHDIYGEEDFEDEEVEAGLLVFSRGTRGGSVWSEQWGRLECAASWYLDDHGLGEVRYSAQPVKNSSSLGLANSTTPSMNDEPYRYVITSWCEALRADHQTGSLILSGRGRLMMIPNYKQQLEKASEALFCDDDDDNMDEPETIPLSTIGLGALYGDDHIARPATHLAVAEGMAAFMSGAHDLPVWVDIKSLLRAAQHPSITPQVRTLSLGESLLQDYTAVIFRTCSCLQLDGSRLLVVGDFLRDLPHEDRNRLQVYNPAVVFDFGSILQAKLSHPCTPVDSQASSVELFFPARTSEEEQELARWRKVRDEWRHSTLILPNCKQLYWKDWSGRLTSKTTGDEEAAAHSPAAGEDGGAGEDQLEPKCNWAGRTAWGEGPHDRNWFDQDFPDDMWGSVHGSEDEGESMDAGEGGGGDGGGGGGGGEN